MPALNEIVAEVVVQFCHPPVAVKFAVAVALPAFNCINIVFHLLGKAAGWLSMKVANLPLGAVGVLQTFGAKMTISERDLRSLISNTPITFILNVAAILT